MRLKISHTTTYDYDEPVPYALQQVRLTPKNSGAQTIINWRTQVTGGKRELSFEDSHRNRVELISFTPGTRQIVLHSEGEVDMKDTYGITGAHGGFMPLWMFLRSTDRTRIGPLSRKIANAIDDDRSPLDQMHELAGAVHAAIRYETGRSDVGWSAEEALAAGHGVCQDHTHAFLACARYLDIPARYVSGYLMMNDRVEQSATHAWAEAHLPDLGWVGFDVSNGISPDTRYVRVATGLDYGDAAPVSGTRYGSGGERLSVVVQVQQQ